jgi:putative inorganic carbon (HCO3(-)) transporter
MSLSSNVSLPEADANRLAIGSPIGLILLLAVTANFLFASGHNLQRCVELVALCLIAAAAVLRAWRGSLPPLPKIGGILLLIFFALGLVSGLSAYSLRHAVFEWTCLFLLLILVFSIAYELAQDFRRINSLLHWVGIACGLYALRVLIMYAAALSTGFQPDWSVLAPGFSNPRFVGHTVTALMPLIVLLCVKSTQASAWRKTWFALAAFWWAHLIAIEARATILALAIGCIMAFVVRRTHARRFVATMAFAALSGTVLCALLFILLPYAIGLHPVYLPWNVLARTVANPVSDRFLLWRLAVELIAGHPWLGIGPQHFAHAGAELYAGAHPHNWILQIAAEWGIPALLCLFGTLFLGARALVRHGARLEKGDLVNQQMLVTLLVSCTAIFVDGMFSGVLVMPQPQLAIALVLGITCAWHFQRDVGQTPARSIQSASWRIVCSLIITVGLCGLIWSVAPDIARRVSGTSLSPAELTANPDKHWPRMWEAGIF